MLAGGSACPTQDLLLLDAFEDHGAVVLPCIGLGGDGDFVALDDARADELGGSAAHVRLDEEGDLVAHHLAIARAITVIESNLPSDGELAARLLDAVLPHTGRALRVGITGVPGVGKS